MSKRGGKNKMKNVCDSKGIITDKSKTTILKPEINVHSHLNHIEKKQQVKPLVQQICDHKQHSTNIDNIRKS